MVRINNIPFTRIWTSTICFFVFLFPVKADYFSKVTLSKREVLPMESTVLSISVYTTTWFTRSADLYDLQIKNSFTIRTGRPQSSYENFNGKRYNIQTFTYHIYPLKVGKQEVPQIEIHFATPEEGQYKGKEVKTVTKTISFEVVPIKQKFHGKEWLVANDISIHRVFSPNKTHWKVGDVVTETIKIRGKGTLASLITPIVHDTLEWATIYHGKIKRTQKVSENNVIATVIQESQFLIEEKGTYSIPAIQLHYYDPTLKKNRTANARGTQWKIKSNPNLTALKQLQDSLKKQNRAKITSDEEISHPWYDKLHWKHILIGAILLVIIWKFAVLLIRIGKKLIKRFCDMRDQEWYLFFRIIICSNQKELYIRINKWYLKLGRKNNEAFTTAIQDSKQNNLIHSYNMLCASLFDPNNRRNISKTRLKLGLIRWRWTMYKKTEIIPNINPQ
ncbi:BatD family protein [Halosquirtibacter xylanolyticus]|uniref:BatD family protein n=1 Tax=Halosquirtibacter xylanolyticus TaxID=3374599 RepID=UPI00374839A3|nr:BatD family protein [Prolixibacteraceae bacterium]